MSEAIEWFRRSVQLEPAPLRHADLASALAADKQSPEARCHYQAAIVLAPKNEAIHDAFRNFLKSLNDSEGVVAEEKRWTTEMAAKATQP